MKGAPTGWKFVDKPYRPIEDNDGDHWALGLAPGVYGIPDTYSVDRGGIRWLAPDDTPEPRRWPADDGSGWWEESPQPWGACDGSAPSIYVRQDGTYTISHAGGGLATREYWVRWVPKETP